MGEGNNENNEGEAPETRGFVRRRIHGQEPTYWVYDTTLSMHASRMPHSKVRLASVLRPLASFCAAVKRRL